MQCLSKIIGVVGIMALTLVAPVNPFAGGLYAEDQASELPKSCTTCGVAAATFDVGQTEYLSSCGVCHGSDGKGKGPLSEQLKVAPPDLTILAKKNSGVFPISAVYEVIDGRKVIAAHGTREMPIWGAFNPKLLYPSDKLMDSSYDPEAIMRTRILAIIDYLNRIQEK